MQKSDPIVFTGCGWVTPFAQGGIPDILEAAASTRPPLPAAAETWRIADADLQIAVTVPDEARQENLVHLAAVALVRARDQARLSGSKVASDRVGLVLGCGLAGLSGMIDFANDVREQSPRFVSPLRFPQTVGNYLAGALARFYDIRGPSITLAGGIGCGLDAVLEAAALLRARRADIVLAGGVDRLPPAIVPGLPGAGPDSVPYSEGACVFALERRSDAVNRGAALLAEIAPIQDEAQLVSSANDCAAGSICIERWVGRCFAALGASVVAAALGALCGHNVPVIDTQGSITAMRPDAVRTVEARVSRKGESQRRIMVRRPEASWSMWR